MAPYAHTQHIKVPQHFVYIQYGCGIQSEAYCGLIDGITTSHELRSTPKTPKSNRDLQRRITVRVAPYAHTQRSIKVPQHFVYIQYIVGSSLKPIEASTMASQHITQAQVYPQNPNSNSTPDLQRGITGPYTAYQGAKTLCIHPIWMWDPV